MHQSNPNECYQAALKYLSVGWSPIPLCPHDHCKISAEHAAECASPGKAPMWPWKTYQERLPKESELKFYWKRKPGCNVGIAMGPVSKLLGLDIDGIAGEELLKSMAGANEIPDTLEFMTPGGGRRLLFVHPDVTINIKSFAIEGKEAIRVLAKGSQTVAPPSIHAKSGTKYAWKDGQGVGEIEPAECPTWLIEALTMADDGEVIAKNEQFSPASPLDPVGRASAYLDKCEPAIAGQGGHNQTFKIAVKLVKGFALDPDTALSLLLSRFNHRCQPPWTEKELEHKIASAAETPGEEGYLLNVAKTTPMPVTSQPASNEPEAHARRFSGIAVEEIKWLWPGWLPLGKLAILDGDPGLGKSTLLLDIAARISTNGMMPSNVQGVSGAVLLMSAEDAAEDTIRPRLEAAGANLDRIFDLSYIKTHKEERPPEIPADLPRIESRIKEHKIKFFVIDPLMAFLYGADANKDQEIRRVLYKLSKIAENNGCTIICMRHLNKGGGGKAIYRGNSSIGVIGHARTGLLVAQDPDDEEKRVLAITKCNLAAKPKALRFILDPKDNVCRIGWMGTTHYTADDLVCQPTKEEKEQKEDNANKTQIAMTILEELLSEGPMEIKTCKKHCSDAGLSLRSVERAVKKLGLDMLHEVDPVTKVQSWKWALHTTLQDDGGPHNNQQDLLLYPEAG